MTVVVRRNFALWFANTRPWANSLKYRVVGRELIIMATALVCIFRLVRLLFSGHQAVVLENAALGMQLAAYRRQIARPALSNLDRFFGIALRQLWSVAPTLSLGSA
jgi:hypothetical protein